MTRARLILSNYGLRLIDHQEATRDAEELAADPHLARLSALRAATVEPARGDAIEAELIARGWVQLADPSLDREAIVLRYERNPLEHVERVCYEVTTVCQLDCLHCRNGHVAPVGEKRIDRLMDAADLMVPLGVERFDFIGGEVTLFGRGWLDLVRHIRGRHPRTRINVLTSGWFLAEEAFRAAGERYADDVAYLAALQEAGLSHVTFSLDGPEAHHDAGRQVPGLYRRVVAGFAKVRAAGLTPQVSLVVNGQLAEEEQYVWLTDLSRQLYASGPSLHPIRAVTHLLGDRMNYCSNFIDVGNAVGIRQGLQDVDHVPDRLLRCKNFFRPYPTLRIRADGRLSLCPLIDAGEGYGSIHAEGGLLHALNHLQDAFIYRLHADDRIAAYRRFVDRELFGERIDHVCSLRTVVGMLAKAMHEAELQPETTGLEHAATIRRLNLDVARRAGFLPPEGPRATGQRDPNHREAGRAKRALRALPVADG